MDVHALLVHGGQTIFEIVVAALERRGFHAPDIDDRPVRVAKAATYAKFGALLGDQLQVSFRVIMCVNVNSFEFAFFFINRHFQVSPNPRQSYRHSTGGDSPISPAAIAWGTAPSGSMFGAIVSYPAGRPYAPEHRYQLSLQVYEMRRFTEIMRIRQAHVQGDWRSAEIGLESVNVTMPPR